MSNTTPAADARVAVLVDCDNTPPDILRHALNEAARYGRTVLRRGYGNGATLNGKWQEALVRQAFTPCLQYTYAAGKNTADMALALDAMEALFDERVDTFCLVTSDSDFAYLCRKLRERGATMLIVGEAKTPAALRNASDQFVEWTPPAPAEPLAPAQPIASPAKPATAPTTPTAQSSAAAANAAAAPAPAPAPAAPGLKRRPRSVIRAVELLLADTSDGRVGLGQLGQYLKRADPEFSPKAYGHSALAEMIRTYTDLVLTWEEGKGYWVGLREKGEGSGG